MCVSASEVCAVVRPVDSQPGGYRFDVDDLQYAAKEAWLNYIHVCPSFASLTMKGRDPDKKTWFLQGYDTNSWLNVAVWKGVTPNKPERILIKGLSPPLAALLKEHNSPGRRQHSLSEAEKDTHAHSWRVASWHRWDLDLKTEKVFFLKMLLMFNLCAHTCTWSPDTETHRNDRLLTHEWEFFAAGVTKALMMAEA